MKWRIDNGNNLRVRLSQPEVSDLHEKGMIMEKLLFPNNMELVYEICCDDTTSTVTAGFIENMIVVRVPDKIIRSWATSDQVAIEGHIDLENGQKLSILVEKDFKKLTRKSLENERDLFPNPRDRRKP